MEYNFLSLSPGEPQTSSELPGCASVLHDWEGADGVSFSADRVPLGLLWHQWPHQVRRWRVPLCERVCQCVGFLAQTFLDINPDSIQSPFSIPLCCPLQVHRRPTDLCGGLWDVRVNPRAIWVRGYYPDHSHRHREGWCPFRSLELWNHCVMKSWKFVGAY